MSREAEAGGQRSRNASAVDAKDSLGRNAAMRELIGPSAGAIREVDLVAEQAAVRGVKERVLALFARKHAG